MGFKEKHSTNKKLSAEARKRVCSLDLQTQKYKPCLLLLMGIRKKKKGAHEAREIGVNETNFIQSGIQPLMV